MKHTCLSIGLLLLLSTCKQDKPPFSEYEGNWKPVSFRHGEGVKTFPADFEYTVSQDGVSFLYRYIKSKSPYIVEIRRYKLEYDVKTYVRDNSILIIDERYRGLDSTGNVALDISSKIQVNLVAGQQEYGYSPNNHTVKPDRIITRQYTTSGLQYTNRYSELLKID